MSIIVHIFLKKIFKHSVFRITIVNHVKIDDKNSYTIDVKDMKTGEKVKCPDQSSEVEKIDENSCRVTFTKPQKIVQLKL